MSEHGTPINFSLRQNHRRWSQKREKYYLDSTTRYNTLDSLCYNGYEAEVGHMYLDQAREGGERFRSLYF